VHELAPRPLLDAVASGVSSWEAEAPVLSIDLVGFTAMAWTLASAGDRGAEALADIADEVFAPIVEAVHRGGGYVAEFGGDAILALFPDGPEAAPGAATAAAAVAEGARRRGPIRTRFGRFDVGVKVALALGEVRWDVLDDEGATTSTYVAWGRAVEQAAVLAATGSPGEVLLDPGAAALLAASFPVEVRDGVHRLGPLDAGGLDDGADEAPAALDPPGEPHPLAGRFAPARLLAWDRRGELRPVVTTFISLAQDAPIEDVRRLVGDVFRLTETYGGVLHQVERAEKGWVVLLYWGAPVSFPGDVERALGLLLALRAGCPVEFRAGTTVGTAFSGLVGAPVQVGFSCYGSHINLAARLMGSAAPGTLLVDASVLGNAAGVAAWRSLGPREFKGVGAPVEVFELLAPSGASVVREHRVVGREAELAALEGVLDRSSVAGRLHHVALVGEPGAGKTVLLETLRRRREGVGGLQWVTCRSESHGIRWLHPVRDLVRRWAGSASGEDVAATSDRFWSRLRALASSSPTGEPSERDLQGHGSFLAALLDLPVPGSAWAATSPEDRFAGMTAAVAFLLSALARSGPLVLVLDDAQWLDPTSRDLLLDVLDGLADCPVTVVVTCHEPEQVLRPAGRAPDLDLRLGLLDLERVGQLAGALLQEEAPGWLAPWLLERSEGNPLFAEQLVTFLAGEGAFDEGRREHPPADVEVPPDLRSVLVARLDRASEAGRRALEAGAVLGRRFERPLLRRTLSVLGVADPHRAEEEALASGLWVADRDDLAFTHELLWAAARDMPLTSTLRTLHAAAAQVLEDTPDEGTGRYVNRLALHHRGAGHLATSARYEVRASELALLLGAYGDAEEHADLGLGDLAALAEESGAPVPPDLEISLALALGSGRMITRGQSDPETFAAYERAHAITEALPPTRQSFQALFGLRMAAAFRGDLRAATALGERALSMATAIGDDDLVLEARLMVGNMEFWHGRLAEAVPTLQRVRDAEVTDSHGAFVQQRRLTALLPLLISRWLATGDPSALRDAAAGVDEARALGHRLSEAIVVETAAFLAALSGDAPGAERHARDLLELAEAEPFPIYVLIARVVLAWAAAARHGSHDAPEDAERAIHDLAAMRVVLGATLMELFHAEAALAVGDLERARRVADSGLRLAARTGEVVMTPLLHLVRARASAGAERRAALEAARASAAAMGQEHVLSLVTAAALAPTAAASRSTAGSPSPATTHPTAPEEQP
jgi:class 3 adenylate cyclase